MNNAIERFNRKVNTHCCNVSKSFGAMALKSQRGCVMVFAVLTGFVSMSLMVKGVLDEHSGSHIFVPQIKTPTDIYMKEGKDDDQLIMVGKLKGEIDGEFEAFYLAVDRNGQIYANHNLTFSEQPLVKSSNWELISRKQLENYEKYLHFLPVRAKSLTF